MRTARVKLDAVQGEACYHLMSRVVGGERLLDVRAREMLRKQIWRTAEFCGIEILTYAILSNHFHLLVRVPRKRAIPDTELLRRFDVLHPRPNRFQQAEIKRVSEQIKSCPDAAEGWRQRQILQMNDVSAFMKLLKQRFSIWFNRNHKRFGTLWAERFKSVLVEGQGAALRTVAAYIDLNPVRAGLVQDPAEYRFCGYGEAVGGTERARMGLSAILGESSHYMRSYRQLLFGKGAQEKSNSASLSQEKLNETIKAGGRIRLALALRCRVKFLSDGLVLGSREFVESLVEILPQFHAPNSSPRSSARSNAHPNAPPVFSCVPEWSQLQLGRRIRGPVIG